MSAEIGRVLGNRYRLIAPIGLGASAQVFLADDVKLRRRVALKMLHDALADDHDFLRRFRAEAQAAAALNHPNVLAIYDWSDDEVAYIVTEYLGGGSLRAVLDRGELLSPSQALMVGLDAARALDYAHRRGFVHRDIKPANLLFGDEQRLRIADFGLARALAEAAWTEPQGAVVGTARYASPEQAKGEKLSGKADVYALALVLIEAITGEVPFHTDTTLGTLMARVDHQLPVPEETGPLREVLERAGHPDPQERIDARTMAAGLLWAAKSLPRPQPLNLVGALLADGAHHAGVDPTVHAPLVPVEPGEPEVEPDVASESRDGSDAQEPAQDPTQSGDRVDATDPAAELNDEDLDFDPPNWVSNAALPMVISPEPEPVRVPVIAASDPEDQDQAALDDSNVLDVEPASPPSPVEVDPEPVTAETAEVTVIADEVDAGGYGDSVGGHERANGYQHDPYDDGGDQDDHEDGRRRRRWPLVLVVLVLLLGAAGVAAALTYDPATPTSGRPVALPLPAVTGLDEAAATQVLQAGGWVVETVPTRQNGTVPGQLLGTDPAAGTRLAKGQTVKVSISEGPTIVALPQGLVGKPMAEVIETFKVAGFHAKVISKVHHEDVAAGALIQYADGTPGEAPWGSEIDLIESTGPAPRSVPGGLSGQSAANAQQALEAVQLRAEITRVFSDTVAEGLVISQGTPGGTEVPRGSTVSLVVSNGPELVAVPDISWTKSLAQAAQVLRDRGLKPGNASGPADGSPKGTSPPFGTKVRKGSTINIILG